MALISSPVRIHLEVAKELRKYFNKCKVPKVIDNLTNPLLKNQTIQGHGPTRKTTTTPERKRN